MHVYYPIYQKKMSKPSFFMIHARKYVSYTQRFFISSPKFINFDTLYETVSKQNREQKQIYIFKFLENIARDSPVLGSTCLIDQYIFI